MSGYFIIQKDDEKSKLWAKAARAQNIEVVAQPDSPIRAPFFFISQCMRVGLPNGYIVRYLNDYPSLFKTLLRLMSEVVLICMLRCSLVPLFWICHNVDRESSRNFPRISSMRRRLFAWASSRVFVTDPLLMSFASLYLRLPLDKIGYVTFGFRKVDDHLSDDGNDVSIALKNLLRIKKSEIKNQGFRPLVTLILGSPGSQKSIHFDYLVNLIDSARIHGVGVIAIVGGDFHGSATSRSRCQQLIKHSQIILFESHLNLTDTFIVENINFYFRGYTDFSVPYTIYESCSFKKPFLVMNFGFLPELINYHGIGVVLNEDSTWENDTISKLENINSDKYDLFLKRHQWSSIDAIIDEVVRTQFL